MGVRGVEWLRRAVEPLQPRLRTDLRPARALINEGRSMREVATIFQVSRTTLRRRLAETV